MTLGASTGTIVRATVVAVAITLLGACATIDSAVRRSASSTTGRTTIIGADGKHAGATPESLVSLVDDPAAEIIASLVQATPQLTAARVAAVAERHAAAGSAWARLLPDASANLGADRNNQALDATRGTQRTETRYTVGLTAGITPDIWGAATNTIRATRAEADAAALATLRSTERAVAQALTAYIQLSAAVQTRAIHDERVRILATIEALVDERLVRGTAGVDDLSNARSTLYAAQADAVASATEVDLLWFDLEALVGSSIEELREAITERDAIPMVALPRSLDTAPASPHRADLMAVDLRARAARHTAYATMSDLLPSLRLEANVFRNDTDVDKVWDARTNWGITGTVTVPLFEGGNRSAQALAAFSAAQARERERDAAYHAASVERTRLITQDRGFRAQRDRLVQAQAEADATVEAFRRRYQDGTIDVEALLTAQEHASTLRAQVVALDAAQNVNRVALAFACGLPVSTPTLMENES